MGTYSTKIPLVLGETLTRQEKAAQIVEETEEKLANLKKENAPPEKIKRVEKELSYVKAMQKYWISASAEEEKPTSLRKEADVQALVVNNIALIGIPGESFSETGLAIKNSARELGFDYTWTVDLANESLGYIPTAEAMEEGGYEPYIAKMVNMAPNAEQLVHDAAVSLLKKCKKPRPTRSLPKRDEIIFWHIPSVEDWRVSVAYRSTNDK